MASKTSSSYHFLYTTAGDGVIKDPRVLFGMKVRTLRKEKGWSQEELAARCFLDRTYIGGIERGERNVALLNIVRIARTLKVKLAELMDF